MQNKFQIFVIHILKSINGFVFIFDKEFLARLAWLILIFDFRCVCVCLFVFHGLLDH